MESKQKKKSDSLAQREKERPETEIERNRGALAEEAWTGRNWRRKKGKITGKERKAGSSIDLARELHPQVCLS